VLFSSRPPIRPSVSPLSPQANAVLSDFLQEIMAASALAYEPIVAILVQVRRAHALPAASLALRAPSSV
jgi:hypothetical protein